MTRRAHRAALAFAAGLAALLAIPAVAAASQPQSATLGSTTGTPNDNICGAMTNCTYVPFASVNAPSLVVPFDGNVTSFSINSGSTGGTVKLRVMRPAGGGQFTGVGTSSGEVTQNSGINAYNVSLPVRKGDVLGLDNDSSALLFNKDDPTPLTAYYESPSLADGSTATPNHTQTSERLLLSAVVQARPLLSKASLTHKRFRLAKHGTAVSAKAPRGTAFRFTLSATADLQITIARRVAGRRHGHRCVASTPKLVHAHAPNCHYNKRVGKLTRAGEPHGPDRVGFTGRIGNRALAPGRYQASLRAHNAGGTSNTVTLAFSVVR